MSEQNKALAGRAIKALNEHNVDTLSSLFSGEYAPHTGQGNLDRKTAFQGAETLFCAFPDVQWTIEDMVAEGDKVVVRYTIEGTHRGEFRGVAPTGKQVSWRGIVIWRCVGGKIAEGHAVSDDVVQMLKG